MRRTKGQKRARERWWEQKKEQGAGCASTYSLSGVKWADEWVDTAVSFACVLALPQLMVYTGFSNASAATVCHSLAMCLPLNVWKSALFKRKNQHLRSTHKQTQPHTNTIARAATMPGCTFTHAHTHFESHIALAWTAFYVDWVQAFSRSESSLEFDMRLKGAMSFQLRRSACQPTQMPLQLMPPPLDFHSCLSMVGTPHGPSMRVCVLVFQMSSQVLKDEEILIFLLGRSCKDIFFGLGLDLRF